MEQMNELAEIEAELVADLHYDQKSWIKFYLSMKKIEDNELYRPEHRSFTAWLKDFCIKNKIHESVVWNRKKAGKTYERFLTHKNKLGESVADLSEINVSMDSLVLIDKIAKKAPELETELVQKALNKEMTRNDLRTAYQIIRGNRDEERKKNIKELEDNHSKREYSDPKVTAAQIVTALANDDSWLNSIRGVRDKDGKVFTKRIEFSPKYRCFNEFPVFTGTTSISRRIDVLVAENKAVEYHYQINLHGLEIKVDKNDLLGDQKYTEYTEFVDYMWLVVPQDLVALTLEVAPKTIGIISYNNKKEQLTVETTASVLNPLRRQESLTTIVLKTI